MERRRSARGSVDPVQARRVGDRYVGLERAATTALAPRRRGPDGVACATGDPVAGWSAFAAAVASRLEAGRLSYGDRSFARPPGALLGEVAEELLDTCAWSFILWSRLHALRERLPGPEAA
jgi:hypothetical protein